MWKIFLLTLPAIIVSRHRFPPSTFLPPMIPDPKCSSGMIWNSCGSDCIPKTCEQWKRIRLQPRTCLQVCLERCECPRGKYLKKIGRRWNRCVSARECLLNDRFGQYGGQYWPNYGGQYTG